MKGDKRAAIEMSIGTIVTIVLSMMMLIGGILLVKNIMGGATNVADLNNQQIMSEIAKLYGDNEQLVIYPNVDIFEVKPGKPTAFAIRIKHLRQGIGDAQFTYNLRYDNIDTGCGFSEGDINNWIQGETGSVTLSPSGESVQKILMTVPEGTALCSFRLIVEAQVNGDSYANEQMYVKIK